MSSRYFHYLCVFLLLVAQQGALVHATWHAHNTLNTHDAHEHAAHVHAGHHDDAHEHRGHYGHNEHNHEAPTGQASLCAFDLAFGQVLGGVHGASFPLPALVPAALQVAEALNTRTSADAVPARSRGPPVVL
jgi:hypothetical protein